MLVYLKKRLRRYPTVNAFLRVIFSNPIDYFRLLAADLTILLGPTLLSQNTTSHSFSFLWFSHSGDFEFLWASLNSLVETLPERDYRIFVFMDKKSPFSIEQQQRLQDCVGVKVVFQKTVYPMAWGGVNTCLSVDDAHRKVAQDLGEDDWIIKVDSDVLFFSRSFFDFLKSGASGDIVGHSLDHMFNDLRVNEFCGGLYATRAGLIHRMKNSSRLIASIRTLFRIPRYRIKHLPEDVFHCVRARSVSAKFESVLFHEPVGSNPRLITKAELIEKFPDGPHMYSIWHFTGQKEKMLPEFEAQVSRRSKAK